MGSVVRLRCLPKGPENRYGRKAKQQGDPHEISRPPAFPGKQQFRSKKGKQHEYSVIVQAHRQRQAQEQGKRPGSAGRSLVAKKSESDTGDEHAVGPRLVRVPSVERRD